MVVVAVLSLLEGESSPRVVQVYPLASRDNLVGRAEWADVGIVDASVSREHVRIQQRHDGWVAVSLSSANPVKVDGRPVPEVPLTPGMVLQLGKVRVRFDADDPRAQPTMIDTGIPKGLASSPPVAAVPTPVEAQLAVAPPPPAVSPAIDTSTPRGYDFDDARVPSRPDRPDRPDRPEMMLSHSVWPSLVWGLLLASGITLWVLRAQVAEVVAAQWPSVAAWVDG